MNEPITLSHKIESFGDEESVIHVDIRRESSAVVPGNMGNILATAEEVLLSEVKDGGSDAMSEDAVQCTGIPGLLFELGLNASPGTQGV